MKKYFPVAKLVPMMALSFLVSGPLRAGQPATNSELISRLEEMQSKHDWQARTRTGAPKLFLLMHQVKVAKILDKLKSGEAVDQKDIDGLFRDHSRL